MKVVLASTSAARRAMLTAAGVSFEAVAPMVDEDELTASLTAANAPPRAVADALAEAKALRVSRRMPDALVIGSDLVLALSDGTMLQKPGSPEALAEQLRTLRGQTHRLIAAAVIASGGEARWRHVDTANLAMREFSDAFLARYVAACGDAVLGSVGGYHIEGMGAQLFATVRGDHFTIRGMPLLAVLDYLRISGALPT